MAPLPQQHIAIDEVEIKDGDTVGVSPKAVLAAALPLLVGIALLIVDVVVLDGDLPDEVWATLLAASPLAGLGAAAGKTGTVKA